MPDSNKKSPKVNLDIEINTNPKVTSVNTGDHPQYQMMQASFQSIKTPYLPPEFLEAYDKVLPGASREIFDLIHEEQKFQMEIKRKEMEFTERNLVRGETIDAANIREQDSLNSARNREIDIKARGQLFAFTITVILLLAAFGFAYLGHIILAGSCIGIIVAMAVVMFLQKPFGHESADGSKVNGSDTK